MFEKFKGVSQSFLQEQWLENEMMIWWWRLQKDKDEYIV